MANLYDNLHDNTGVYGFPSCLPGRETTWLFLMDIQLILSLVIGLCASWYILKKIKEKFQKVDQNPKCGPCSSDEKAIQSNK